MSLNLKDASLEDALEEVLSDNNYTYKVIANTITINNIEKVVIKPQRLYCKIPLVEQSKIRKGDL
ncbi:STN domain-containing protein [Sphingobacterium sp. IITKGP-BTPF85]|uniref:STN domain-containing protein n=1 Tax=Sphingobacterium sp. IITKGP-BTPF85 TaxID=1338009 RepID=UPI0039780252